LVGQHRRLQPGHDDIDVRDVHLPVAAELVDHHLEERGAGPRVGGDEDVVRTRLEPVLEGDLTPQVELRSCQALLSALDDGKAGLKDTDSKAGAGARCFHAREPFQF
jgi:hypothetical protein